MEVNATTEWSNLRHDLGNTISRLSASEIVRLYQATSLDIENDKRGVEGLFSDLGGLISKARILLRDLVGAFSPVQLIDLGPLGQYLPEDALSIIRDALHHAYLEQTRMLELKVEIECRTNQLEISFHKFILLWRRRSSTSPDIEDSILEMIGNARALFTALCDLPEGVVLP